MSLLVCPSCKTQLNVEVAKFHTSPVFHKPAAAVTVKTEEDIGELLDAVDVASLDGKALEFYEACQERYKKYGMKTLMSERQMAWLKTLAGASDF